MRTVLPSSPDGLSPVHPSSSSPSYSSPPKKSPGGWRAVKYILGNESFEKLASMSLIANITLYMRNKYNMDGISLVNAYSIWSGSSNFTPLVGAFISDSYLGKYRTLLYGCLASFLALGTLTMTAAIPSLRPPACVGERETECPRAKGWQLSILFLALGLHAIGSGGLRPCNIAFGADQFDTKTEKGRTQLESFFNWWYFSFTVALLIALTGVVYVQTNVSWVLGYAIPTACFFISIFVFLIGKHSYIIVKPQGSVFVDIAKVISAACRKRSLNAGLDAGDSLYNPPISGSEPQAAKLAHTDRFRFLDKAAIVADPSELDDQGNPKNGWSLCSLQQVEHMKLLLGIWPVWLTGIGCFITMDQMNSIGILQAIQTNNSIGPHFKAPPAWMGLSSMIALSTWILIYEKLYIPQARKFAKKDRRMTMKQRINAGIVMAILCMVVAAIIEKKRRDSALKHGSFTSPMSIAWLLPQFALSGLVEAFAAVAIMEFFTTHLPDSMRTVAGAIFFLSLAISSYLNSTLVNIVHRLTVRNGKPAWLGGRDLNQDRLEYFYFLIAGIAVLNLVYFNLFASRFLARHTGHDRDSSSIKHSSNSESNREERILELKDMV